MKTQDVDARGGGGGPTSTSIYNGSSYDCLHPTEESQLLHLWSQSSQTTLHTTHHTRRQSPLYNTYSSSALLLIVLMRQVYSDPHIQIHIIWEPRFWTNKTTLCYLVHWYWYNYMLLLSSGWWWCSPFIIPVPWMLSPSTPSPFHDFALSKIFLCSYIICLCPWLTSTTIPRARRRVPDEYQKIYVLIYT